MAKFPKFHVGQRVMHRGAWGNEPPTETVIEVLELTTYPREKYGEPVEMVFEGEHFVCTLANGKWAYDFQIEPINPQTPHTND